MTWLETAPGRWLSTASRRWSTRIEVDLDPDPPALARPYRWRLWSKPAAAWVIVAEGWCAELVEAQEACAREAALRAMV